jgi:hypothetical protein
MNAEKPKRPGSPLYGSIADAFREEYVYNPDDFAVCPHCDENGDAVLYEVKFSNGLVVPLKSKCLLCGGSRVVASHFGIFGKTKVADQQ